MKKKRRKKKGLSGIVPAGMPKAATSALGTYGLAALGIAGAVIALKQVDKLLPASVPPVVKNVVPGLVTAGVAFFLSTKIENKYAKFAFLGMGTGAVIDIGRKVVPAIAAYTPSLSGLRGFPYRAWDTGDYPVSYYERNSFQGLGNTPPFALNGNTPFALNGDTAYAMSGLPVNGLPVNGMGFPPFALN